VPAVMCRDAMATLSSGRKWTATCDSGTAGIWRTPAGGKMAGCVYDSVSAAQEKR
jgi:hypothetical protein